MEWLSHNKTMFHTHKMHQLSDYDPLVFMVELALLKLGESEYSDLTMRTYRSLADHFGKVAYLPQIYG